MRCTTVIPVRKKKQHRKWSVSSLSTRQGTKLFLNQKILKGRILNYSADPEVQESFHQLNVATINQNYTFQIDQSGEIEAVKELKNGEPVVVAVKGFVMPQLMVIIDQPWFQGTVSFRDFDLDFSKVRTDSNEKKLEAKLDAIIKLRNGDHVYVKCNKAAVDLIRKFVGRKAISDIFTIVVVLQNDLKEITFPALQMVQKEWSVREFLYRVLHIFYPAEDLTETLPAADLRDFTNKLMYYVLGRPSLKKSSTNADLVPCHSVVESRLRDDIRLAPYVHFTNPKDILIRRNIAMVSEIVTSSSRLDYLSYLSWLGLIKCIRKTNKLFRKDCGISRRRWNRRLKAQKKDAPFRKTYYSTEEIVTFLPGEILFWLRAVDSSNWGYERKRWEDMMERKLYHNAYTCLEVMSHLKYHQDRSINSGIPATKILYEKNSDPVGCSYKHLELFGCSVKTGHKSPLPALPKWCNMACGLVKRLDCKKSFQEAHLQAYTDIVEANKPCLPVQECLDSREMSLLLYLFGNNAYRSHCMNRLELELVKFLLRNEEEPSPVLMGLLKRPMAETVKDSDTFLEVYEPPAKKVKERLSKALPEPEIFYPNLNPETASFNQSLENLLLCIRKHKSLEVNEAVRLVQPLLKTYALMSIVIMEVFERVTDKKALKEELTKMEVLSN